MKAKELLLTGLLVLLCAMPNVAMAADTTVTRSYPFESATIPSRRQWRRAARPTLWQASSMR
mgnify:CR=1 FL=1